MKYKTFQQKDTSKNKINKITRNKCDCITIISRFQAINKPKTVFPAPFEHGTKAKNIVGYIFILSKTKIYDQVMH